MGSQRHTATHEPRIMTMDCLAEEMNTCPACRKCELAGPPSIPFPEFELAGTGSFSFACARSFMASPRLFAGFGAEQPRLRGFPGISEAQSPPIPTHSFEAAIQESR